MTKAKIDLAVEIRRLIEEARANVATSVNSALTVLYWRIGKRILQESLRGTRADYGKEILPTLSAELVPQYGRGFSGRSLWRMVQFTQAFPNFEVVASLSGELSWSHIRELLPLRRPLQRQFYAEMCRVQRWSVRTLRSQIGSALYERTALSKRPQAVAEAQLAKLRSHDQISPDLLLKDPYILDFLRLNDRYIERDLEDAILRELERFLLELGAGFSFVARQMRLQIDGDDFSIDLLFFNRRLRRLVAIELKLDDFKAEYKGQMELYLRWLEKNERGANEESPLGIILCTGKKSEQIELLELDKTGIHVAEYLTELPPKKLLQRKLKEAVTMSRARFENRRKPVRSTGSR